MAKKYYWLRLKRDFFKRHDIRIIESMPNGKDYILFYLKLLCESVDHEGNLRFSDEIPYNEDMLATITDTNVDIVRSAIQIFSKLHMMDLLDDGTYYMNEVEKLLGSETEWAEKKRNQKELPKLSNGSRRLNAEMLLLPDGSRHFVDEKRYGGNGMLALDMAGGRCEVCGSSNGIVIHHNNGYSNNIDDLFVLCTQCHGKVHAGGGKFPPLVHHRGGHFPPEIEIDKEIDKDKDINILPGKPDHAGARLEIIAYLNQQTGKDFRHSSKANVRLVEARLNEGYSVEDFKKVIDNKVAEWKGTEQEQYLRPETLFAPSHFESYLNQRRVRKKGTGLSEAMTHNYDMDDLRKRAKE